jgi:hypothetical protein
MASPSWLTYLLLICTGDLDSMGLGGPLTEGGVRYTIHPVTGHLITTEVQTPAKDASVSGVYAHKPQREDKFIIKVRLCLSVCLSVCLSGFVCLCVCGWSYRAQLAVLLLMLLLFREH